MWWFCLLSVCLAFFCDKGVASTLFIQTSTKTGQFSGVETVLNQLRETYDVITTSTYESKTLEKYTTVLIAMDGGDVVKQSFQNLHDWVSGSIGRRLIILGGCSSSAFGAGS